MEHIEHKICLELNSAGYSDADIDNILPEFTPERDTSVVLRPAPSAHGPESFTLGIVVGATLSALAQGFLLELSKDLYQWVKSKLIPLFKQKTFPVGYLEIKIDKIVVFSLVEEVNRLADIFENLPKLLRQIGPNIFEGEWEINYNKKIGRWSITYHSPKKKQ